MCLWSSLTTSSSLHITDCSTLPPSMNKNRPERGCPGAVYTNGEPSQDYCNGRNHYGTEGFYPWWSNCCFWDTSLNVCQPKHGNQNHK